MSNVLFLFFSLPVVIYLSFVISEKYFNKSKKAFYIMFYSILGILIITLGVGFFFTVHKFAMQVSLVKKIVMGPILLLMGSGLTFGLMAIIKPSEYAKFLMQHKKLFLTILGTFIFLTILDRFL